MKDLKTEYQNMIDSEAPDLWGRIASGLGDNREGAPIPAHIQEYLDEEEVSDDTAKVISGVFNGDHTVADNRGKTGTGRAKAGRRTRRVGSIMAACLTAAVIIPVLLMLGVRIERTKMAEQGTHESTAEMAVDTMDTDEEAYDILPTKAPVEEMMEEAAAETPVQAPVMEAADSEAGTTETTDMESADAEMEIQIRQVKVRVLSSVMVEGVEFYVAEVLEAEESTGLKQGDRIWITADEQSPADQEELQDSREYDLHLQLKEDKGAMIGLLRQDPL